MRENGIKQKKNRGVIICIGNWHGRTLGAPNDELESESKEWIGYHDPNIFHNFPYPWDEKTQINSKKFFEDSIKNLCTSENLDPKKDICGFMLETFQGWGSIFYPNDYVKALSDFAKENDILLTFDEMQSGFGRTGKLFGYMHYDVEPDLLCCGKGASSGFPLAIVLGFYKDFRYSRYRVNEFNSFFNPLVCAAGKANLECLFEDGLLKNSDYLGKIFIKNLNKIKDRFENHISDVQGKGLIAALIFVIKREPLTSLCDQISELCLQGVF